MPISRSPSAPDAAAPRGREGAGKDSSPEGRFARAGFPEESRSRSEARQGENGPDCGRMPPRGTAEDRDPDVHIQVKKCIAARPREPVPGLSGPGRRPFVRSIRTRPAAPAPARPSAWPSGRSRFLPNRPPSPQATGPPRSGKKRTASVPGSKVRTGATGAVPRGMVRGSNPRSHESGRSHIPRRLRRGASNAAGGGRIHHSATDRARTRVRS
jgi:hypothetical protein